MELLKIKVLGTSPLLMHRDTFADPLKPATIAHKQLTSKRKKTEDDHQAIARSEYVSSLYWHAADGIFVPGQNFDSAFFEGAKLQKLGVRWKRGALVVEDRVRLAFDGPSSPDALWDDKRFVDCRGVKIGASKVMRYRPIFLEWAAELTVQINTDVLDPVEAKKAMADAGALIGVCDYRPRFGRFSVAA